MKELKLIIFLVFLYNFPYQTYGQNTFHRIKEENKY